MSTPQAVSAVRVSKLGYLGFETPDLDRMIDYYTNVLDFHLEDRSPGGAFLTTGPDHHCVVLTKGGTRARAPVGYEIWEPPAAAERPPARAQAIDIPTRHCRARVVRALQELEERLSWVCRAAYLVIWKEGEMAGAHGLPTNSLGPELLLG